jgi:hypothetical protein
MLQNARRWSVGNVTTAISCRFHVPPESIAAMRLKLGRHAFNLPHRILKKMYFARVPKVGSG